MNDLAMNDKAKAIDVIHGLLRTLISRKGSDLFVTANAPPSIKVDGKVTRLSNEPLSSSRVHELVRAMMNDRQAAQFDQTQECNFAIGLPGAARFRVNAFWQRGSVGAVVRTINTEIPTIEELRLPPILQDISMTKRGLVIFVGGTGCGKTTSLAAMIGYRN